MTEAAARSSVAEDREARDGGDATLSEDLKVIGSKTIEPTPEVLDALKQAYPIETSIADLVDNSIDAEARHVLVRFMQSGNRLTGLCVVDDGRGMDNDTIDRAMQFAGRRKYCADDLGMFGIGLKTASLSQADTVTVLSRCSSGGAVGRRWTEAGIKSEHWKCSIIAPESVRAQLGRQWGPIGSIQTGTIVRWDKVHEFDRLRGDVVKYLEQVYAAIRTALGLKLHRFLERRKISLTIDVQDMKTDDVGPPSTVEPLNPFPPDGLSGARRYPKVFTVEVPRIGKLKLTGHIWRKRSSAERGYRLGGGKVSEHQGFYFYRHNRLIQDGGWNGYKMVEPHSSLARVAIDIPDSFAEYFRVRPNKAGIDTSVTFADEVKRAVARDGTNFEEYLAKAQETYRRRGEQKADPIIPPGDGVPAPVKQALEKLGVPTLRGPSLVLRWQRLPGKEVFHVDLRDRELLLNKRYRQALLAGRNAGGADLPVLRTLLFLLLEPTFGCERIGRVEKMRLASIQAALLAAVKLEASKREK